MRRSLVSLAVLAVGLLISLFLGFIPGALCADFILETLEGPERLLELTALSIAVCLSGGAGVLWLWAHFNWRFTNIMAPTRQRSHRLDSIVKHALACERVPHRGVEHTLRARYYPWANTAALMKHLRGWLVVVVNGPRIGTMLRPAPAESAFEPVNLAIHTEELACVIQQNVEMQVGRSATENTEDDRARVVSWNIRSLRLGAFAGFAVSWGFIVHFGYSLVRYQSLEDAVYLGVFVVLILATSLGAAIIGRSWWLVPGGLVLREAGTFRRRCRFTMFTPDDTPLVLDWRANVGWVRGAKKTYRFRFAEGAGWAITAGWMSTAHRPTLDQIRGLLDSSEPSGDDEGRPKPPAPTVPTA